MKRHEIETLLLTKWLKTRHRVEILQFQLVTAGGKYCSKLETLPPTSQKSSGSAQMKSICSLKGQKLVACLMGIVSVLKDSDTRYSK
jgi:hypothetical protein